MTEASSLFLNTMVSGDTIKMANETSADNLLSYSQKLKEADEALEAAEQNPDHQMFVMDRIADARAALARILPKPSISDLILKKLYQARKASFSEPVAILLTAANYFELKRQLKITETMIGSTLFNLPIFISESVANIEISMMPINA